MNVSLAVPTISCGVADALEYLKCGGNENFINSAATIKFIRIFDRIFDVMNSRNCFGSGYKSPMSLENRSRWEFVFRTTAQYIQEDLFCGDISILDHPRRTFALGFLINIKSYENIAVDLLTVPENPLKYFLTYKTSQDNNELLFCCIRSMGGWNDNPNIMLFRWSLRKLLFRNSVAGSKQANVDADVINEMGIFQLTFSNVDSANFHFINIEEEYNINNLISVLNDIDLSGYQNNILWSVVAQLDVICESTTANIVAILY